MRPFIVPICNTREPFPGIVSIRLPLRSGASPLDFSMTRFNKAKLPASRHPRTPVPPGGTPSGASQLVPSQSQAPAMRLWSQPHRLHRRCLLPSSTRCSSWREKVPIFSFPTQQWSGMHAVASARVLNAWYHNVAPIFADPRLLTPSSMALLCSSRLRSFVRRWSARTRWRSAAVHRARSTPTSLHATR